jgi:glycosyltransferase involved in cell wall biosynthesis
MTRTMATTGSAGSEPLVSIIINNYNYDRFLKAAIDSALEQTYRQTEVIVVDDGSTDDSRKIIESYGDRVIPVFKPNGGQASAFNTGIETARGDIICFLDSDDIFHPDKIEKCVALLREKMQTNPLVMVYHLLEVVDQEGNSLNCYDPVSVLNYAPNSYEHACKYRDIPFHGAPTSGNIFTRKLAELVFPIPEQVFRICADNVIVRAMGLLGEVYGMNQALGQYRFHGNNNYRAKTHNDDLAYRVQRESRDAFLNAKLVENAKKPVLSHFESMNSKYYYQRSGDYNKVFQLGLKVIQWRLSQETLIFFMKACIQYCLWSVNPSFVKFKEG